MYSFPKRFLGLKNISWINRNDGPISKIWILRSKQNLGWYFLSWKMFTSEKSFDPNTFTEPIKWLHQKKFGAKKSSGLKNKPSFCSGSCDEWHATMNFQKQNNLETPSQELYTFIKHFRNFLENQLKLPWNNPWNPLETPLELCLKGHLTLVWITCETLLKYPWNFPKAPMKLS